MKKTIRDYDLEGKKVIIRVDFNVPIKDGIIQDDNRIKESLQTINYAIDNNAKVILLSHLGKVKTQEDKIKNNLEPISARLSDLLNRNVIFINDTRGKEVEDVVNNMNEKDVILLQNTRYEDLNGEKESSNDPELGEYWASLGDIFINDAFGTSHRSHASNVGIASHLPNGIGFLVEKELNTILPAINNPIRPFTVILGGFKVSDKIGVIENLVNKADYILIGGAMAFTFLYAQGIEIGSSILDKENVDFCKKILKENEDKIILPIDVMCSTKEDAITKQCFITDMLKGDTGCDIGPQTVKLFNNYLKSSKTIIWNGPVGKFEVERFSYGTKTLLKELSNIENSTIILGGGDTSSAAINYGYKDIFTHISTGGGASLYLLAGKNLPGSDIINDK
ncbi:MAG: phosphoglycerate kinase [Clostridium sp.]|nr:phosphoglycerate kinase [Clostridium sp.]MCM1444146.1 phosphoglycerate kinase [Candidatus Amulumruptor caecigallinarius]